MQALIGIQRSLCVSPSPLRTFSPSVWVPPQYFSSLRPLDTQQLKARKARRKLMGLADGVGAPADGADAGGGGGGGEGAESSGELLACVGIRLMYPPPATSSVPHAPADDPVYVVQLEEGSQEGAADRQRTAHRTPYLQTPDDAPLLLPASALELLAKLFKPSRWATTFGVQAYCTQGKGQ